MAIHVRIDGDLAILSGLGRLMNDPRYVDAARDVRDLLDRGHRRFIVELAGIREAGPPFLGLLTTLTRQIRQRGGDIVLARVSRPLEKLLDEMRMDDVWDVFDDVDEAKSYFRGRNGHGTQA